MCQKQCNVIWFLYLRILYLRFCIKSGNLYFKSRKIDMFEEKSEKIEIQLNPTCYFKHPGERKKYFEIAGVLNDWGANPRGTVIDLSLK